jgi:hypothetical protein
MQIGAKGSLSVRKDGKERAIFNCRQSAFVGYRPKAQLS